MNASKIILVFLVSAALSGCVQQHKQARLAGASRAAAPYDIAKEIAAEEKGWQKVAALSAAQCGATATPPAPAQAVALSDCVNGLVKDHVLPCAADPNLLLASRAQARELAQAYAGGRITAVQYRSLSQERLQAYRARLKDRQVLQAARRQWIGDRPSSQGRVRSI